jgi:hypothetical protein
MAVRVHGHKTGVQKSRVLMAACAREVRRHVVNHIVSNHETVCSWPGCSQWGFAGVVIGPPIMVIDSGVVSPRVAIREMAANTGTVGWLYADDVAIALYALEVADEFCT